MEKQRLSRANFGNTVADSGGHSVDQDIEDPFAHFNRGPAGIAEHNAPH
jgi:hypothetical protein